jgi:hypothetical protein
MNDGLRQLERLRGSVGPELQQFLPQVVDRGFVAGQAYWAEKLRPGVPGTKFPWKFRWRRSAIRAGAQFIRTLHVETKRITEIDDELIFRMLNGHVLAIEKTVHLMDRQFSLRELFESIRNGLCGRSLNLVRSHGDFWPGNVLVTQDGRLSTVLDWDQSKESGWPLLDLFHLIVHQQKHRATWYFGDIVVERLMPKKFRHWESELVRDYCAALDLGPELWPFFVALYWLDHVLFWTQTDFGDPEVVKGSDAGWIRRNIIAPLPRLSRELRNVRE